jgi:hypothetical protein
VLLVEGDRLVPIWRLSTPIADLSEQHRLLTGIAAALNVQRPPRWRG